METLAYLATVDLTPLLPQITTPALVMVGELSSMNTPDRAQRMVELFPHRTLVQSAWSEWLCAALCTGTVRGAIAGFCQDLQSSLRRAIKEFPFIVRHAGEAEASFALFSAEPKLQFVLTK